MNYTPQTQWVGGEYPGALPSHMHNVLLSDAALWPFPLTLPVKQPNTPLPKFNPNNFEDAPL